jgi:PAS domain S-box-containing protein
MSEPLKESTEFPGARPAEMPVNEAERLQALHQLDLLDTLPEQAFDDIVQIACVVCGVPIALVSLVDSERQWFKARVGLDATQTHRDLAFCAHAINTPEQLFEIADATADPRFAANPLVTGELGIRFYAGTPLLTADGHAIGTLCVIDRVPRKLDDGQIKALEALGRRVMNEVQLRSSIEGLEATRREMDAIQQLAERRNVLLESILASIPTAVIAIDPQRQIVVYNEAARQINGFTAADIPEDRSRWPEKFGIRDPASGRVLDLAEMPTSRALLGEAVLNMPLMFQSERRPLPRYADASALPMYAADGSSLGAVLVMTDITERKQAEAALARSEASHRFLLEAIPLQVWTAKPNGDLDYVNEFTVNYMGLPAQRLIDESWDALLHPDDIEAAMKLWAHSIATGEPYDAEYRLLRADGSYRWNLARGLALKNAAGEVEKWFGSRIDIEAIKNAQQVAEEATRTKSAFLSSMSHEIRTPMNAVIGMTSILLDSPLTAEQREYAEVIRTSGDHLLTIINDILDYSKIEAGKLELESSAFSLRECIEDALDLIAATATTQGVELGYLMAAGTPESVLGDIGRLRQVLLNLLSNAVKFTPPGGEVMVDARTQRLADGRHRIEFSVSDSGVGIDADVLPQLFQPFVQADASTTRKYGGTGLGLSISRRLVEAMGGSISAASTPGRGSVFRFDILAAAAALPARDAPPTLQPQLGGQRVLIVDDNQINRRILIHYVSSWGMLPQATGSPREALEWLQRGAVFELALFDYHMPEMDGLSLSRRCRQLVPMMPIVMLSSVMLEPGDTQLVSGSLLKPIKPARLLAAVAELLTPTGARSTPAAARVELPHELGREHPLRLLVVEDNPVNQQVARRLLERMGYLADFAGNGQEALDSVARQTYDAVLMDVQMPVMDGLTATRTLCRLYPAAERPRIIGMTANATEDDRRDCAHAGMDDYLPKPVRPQQLAAALRATRRRVTDIKVDEDYSAEGLAELRRIYDEEGAVEIIGALVTDLAAQSLELQRSLELGDVRTLQRVAHTLKSTSRLVGALRLGDDWDELERLVDAGMSDISNQRALRLIARYDGLVQRLRRETAR